MGQGGGGGFPINTVSGKSVNRINPGGLKISGQGGLISEGLGGAGGMMSGGGLTVLLPPNFLPKVPPMLLSPEIDVIFRLPQLSPAGFKPIVNDPEHILLHSSYDWKLLLLP
jgi:hypothetical protein